MPVREGTARRTFDACDNLAHSIRRGPRPVLFRCSSARRVLAAHPHGLNMKSCRAIVVRAPSTQASMNGRARFGLRHARRVKLVYTVEKEEIFSKEGT